MATEKTTRQNRVREALGRIYDQQPPYFREYLRRFQEDPTSRVFAPLAEAYRRLGRVDEAIEICREGLEHHPDFHGGRVALAKCYLDKKRYDDARAELEKVVHAIPENLLAQRLLGDTYVATLQLSSALHCYKMALLLSPNDVGLAEKVHALEREVREHAAEEEAPVSVAPAPPVPKVAKVAPKAAVEAPVDVSISDDLGLGGDDPLGGGLDSSDSFADPLSGGMGDFDLGGGLGDGLDDSANPFPADSATLDPMDERSISFMDTAAAEDEEADKDRDRSKIDELLGATDEPEEEAFKIEHVSAIFEETPAAAKEGEITTGTLGDLYFAQGQFDRALRIFEKLYTQRPLPDLLRKINACKGRMGVDRDAMARVRKIEALRAVLKKVQADKLASGID